MTVDQGFAVIIGALLGFIIAIYTFRQKNDELFFKALEFLEGGTQKRNLGISAIELYWKTSRHQKLCVPLLIGTAIYLLKESKQKDAAHELSNMDRIMFLLLTPEAIRLADTYPAIKENYKRLKLAIDERIEGKEKNDKANPESKMEEQGKVLTDIIEAEKALHKAVKAVHEPESKGGLIVERKDLENWKTILIRFS